MTGSAATVVIVTYNSADVIGDCLSFLDDARSDEFDVVVIDNASTDATVSVLATYGDRIRFIPNHENTGFARAVNRAVSESAPARSIVLLNPDAVVTGQDLGRLVGALTGSPGIVGPSINRPDGGLKIASAGREPTTWRMFTHYWGLSHLPGKLWEGHYLRLSRLTADRTVDWVTGACLAISREAWDRVGGLTERWFMYAEDVQLCAHVRAAGYPVAIRPNVHATHIVGHSSNADSRVNSAWIVNLYDYFCGEVSTGPLDRWMWKLVTTTGLLARSVAFQALGASASQAHRRHDARRFLSYARDLWRTPPSAPRSHTS
jgi:GT2 family glycosyltransferase